MLEPPICEFTISNNQTSALSHFLSSQLTTVGDDGWLGIALGKLGRARTVTRGLESLDNLHRLLVSHLAKDDVLVVKPVRLDGRDEELRAVPVLMVSLLVRKRHCEWRNTHVLGPELAMDS